MACASFAISKMFREQVKMNPNTYFVVRKGDWFAVA